MYAERRDLEAHFGAGEIESLAPASEDPDRTAGALADASAEIDAHLGGRYALPLPAGSSWPLLTSIACDIARLRLYDDAAPEIVLGRASSARAQLRRIGDGVTALVDSDGAMAPLASGGGAYASEPGRSFTAGLGAGSL